MGWIDFIDFKNEDDLVPRVIRQGPRSSGGEKVIRQTPPFSLVIMKMLFNFLL
jgi:hypothetical protein